MTHQPLPRALDQIEGIHPSKTKTMSEFVVDLSVWRALADCQEACWDVDVDGPAPRVDGNIAVVDVSLFEEYETPNGNEQGWKQLQQIVGAAKHDKIDVLVLFW